MQDVYFLRKDGCVTDQYFSARLTNTFFPLLREDADLFKVFEFAAEEGLLHLEYDALPGRD